MYKSKYRIISYLVSHNFLDKENENIYNYGFYSFINYFLIFSSLLISASLNDNLVVSLFTITLLFAFRSNVGGFHFNNSNICIIVSLVISVIIPFLLRCLIIDTSKLLLFILLSSIFILYSSPVDSKNRRLSLNAKRKLKTGIKYIVLLLISLSFCLYVTNVSIMLLSFSISYFYCTILLILGIIDNIFIRKRDMG